MTLKKQLEKAIEAISDKMWLHAEQRETEQYLASMMVQSRLVFLLIEASEKENNVLVVDFSAREVVEEDMAA